MSLPPPSGEPHDKGVPDEVLMSRVAQRDQQAFTALVRRHQDGLVNFFRRMGDYNHADDLTQETFVRLFRYRDRYRATARFTTFLYTLGRRVWIDHCRARGRRKKAYEKLADEAELRQPAGTDALDEAGARAKAALDELSDDMRTVVVMSIYQGFKYREIADILGVPLGTVKTRMFHAMRRLRETLTNERQS